AEYDAKSFAKAPEPTPEQLQSFYQAQQEKFRIPRQVKVAYVEFPIRDEAVTPPSDAQVQDFYEHHPEQFFDAQGRPQPIEKMKPLIQKAIVQQQSVDKTGKAATDFSLKFATDAGERPDFRKAAADAHLTLKETDFLGPESKPAGIDSPERFLDEVSKLSKDNPVTLPIVGPNAIYVASLLDSKESRIPVLDEIKAKIVSIWKENWSITQAREAGQKAREAFRQKLAEGQSPEQAAKAAGITWKNLPDLSFQQARADFNDPSRVYLQACGRLPAGAVSDFEPLPTGGFFLYVKQRKLENSAELMQQRPMFAATLAHSLQGIDWEEFQRATAEEAGLKFDPRALR
ncbi:MAG: peptidyl-prolyl cis-trans isomerase, partial [Verrucomicrobiae bacterium]|nr:peptidyl-prolyl cis-trans isomerase [Verrucomicrobiae bacterium]